jgi:hypothetical protein
MPSGPPEHLGRRDAQPIAGSRRFRCELARVAIGAAVDNETIAPRMQR